MIYNIALIPEKEHQDKIIKIKKDLLIKVEEVFKSKKKYIPHLTLLKFESDTISEKELTKIFQLENKINKITIYCLRILKDKSEYWMELGVEKNKEIYTLHEKLVHMFKDEKILSRTMNEFRPHITLTKAKSNNIIIKEIHFETKVKLVIGKSEPEFQIEYQ